MNEYITSAFPPTILNHKMDRNISITMPTHRISSEHKKDILVFKNIMSELEGLWDVADKSVINTLNDLVNDLDFWLQNKDSLVILANEKDINIYRLPRTLDIDVRVGEEFNLNPLFRNFQSDNMYYALGLGKKEFKLYLGNRYGFEEVTLPKEVLMTSEEVLGTDKTENRISVVSQGGLVGNYYGQGSRSDEEKIDTTNFFRYVNKEVEDISRKNGIPVILVALSEHQGLFRSISDNPLLVDKGLNQSFESMQYEDLSRELWQVLEPIYLEKTKKLLDLYHEGLNKGLSTDSIKDIVNGLEDDSVHKVVIESGRKIPGVIEPGDDTSIDDYSFDILNRISETAARKNVEVVILPKDRMPSDSGIFALYRFKYTKK